MKHMQKIKKMDDGCWIWQGCINKKGYGQLTVNMTKWKAHRFFYNQFVGPIPKGMFVCHKCDIPACCNPEHLFLGTPKDNTQDMINKSRNSKPPIKYGEMNNLAKLTQTEVNQIRAMYKVRSTPQHEIAKQFGIHQTTVSDIIRRKVWK